MNNLLPLCTAMNALALRTTRISSTQVARYFSNKVAELEQESRLLLQHENPSLRRIESLLEEWASFVNEESVVERMDDLYRSWLRRQDKFEKSRPFAIMLDAWSHCGNGHAALDVLEAWNQHLGGDLAFAPTREHYHSVIKAFQNDSDVISAAQVAIEVLERLKEWGFTMAPTAETYNLVSNCLYKAIGEIDHDEILPVMDLCVAAMIEMTFEGGVLLEDLDEMTVQALMQTLCNGLCCVSPRNSDDYDWYTWSERLYDILVAKRYATVLTDPDNLGEAVVQVQRLCIESRSADRSKADILFEPMQKRFGTKYPTLEHYHLAIKAYKHVTNAEKVRVSLLEKMEGRFHEVIADDSIQPDKLTEAYNRWMLANYDSGRIYKVKELWGEMLSRKVRRNRLSFSTVLKALADLESLPFTKQAHSILQKLVNRERDVRFFQPDGHMFASVMAAWANSRHQHAGEFCQQLFNQMLAEVPFDDSLKPTVVHYSALIKAWSWHEELAVSKVLNVFQKMQEAGIDPNEQAYSTVLRAMARSRRKEGAERAEEILNEMEKRGYARRESYASVMYAWANSSVPEAPERCRALLERVEQMYESNKDPSMRPNSDAYRALVQAWINTEPTRAGDLGEALLQQVENSARVGKCEYPDAKLFNIVMTAFAKSGDRTRKIEECLHRMKVSFASGNVSAKPDGQAMTTLLFAYAKSYRDDKAVISWEILQEMCKAYEQGDVSMRPTSSAFSAVLNACAFTRCDSTAFQEKIINIALQVMNELEKGKYDEPSGPMYLNLFRILGRHMNDPSEATRVAEVFFQRCCQDGLLNDLILKELRMNIPGLYSKLPKGTNKRELQLPDQWSRNVPKGRSSSAPSGASRNKSGGKRAETNM